MNMRDLNVLAKALRRLAETSPRSEASCLLGNGLRVTVHRADTVTGERVYTLTVARHHTPPHPDDLAPIAQAFGVPVGAEWNWHGKPGSPLYTAWCRWHERSAERQGEAA